MAAKYLIRIDDICPTMNWAVWREIESLLMQWDIKPLLAVVPDNQDDALKRNPPDLMFWDHVRRWRAQGWSIGMHGYQHKYVTNDPGIIGINKYSEFAGLPREMQASKLYMACEIFLRQEIEPDVWIAPAHSFDRTTVDLLKETGLGRISGGFSLFPSVDSSGVLWIPQQLWRFRAMPFGVWTVCLHPNDWGPREVLSFERNIDKYRENIVTLDDVVTSYGDRQRSLGDSLFEAVYLILLRSRCKLSSWQNHLATQATVPSRPKVERLSDRV